MSNYRPVAVLLAAIACGFPAAAALAAKAQPPKAPQDTCVFNDSHFHLTNYVQTGTDAAKYVDEIMGDKVCRSTLFGIPLQQTWAHGNSGDFAPTYYLQTDAPLYYYSFTDAYIARAFQKLKPAQQARLDPMITGFNPADMYAADHIRRVLETFPGSVHGHRRVHDPQGIRLVEGRGRSREPHRSGARPDPGVCGRGRSRRHPAQRHRHAVRQGRRGTRLSHPDEGPAAPSSAHHDHLGAHRARPRRPSCAAAGRLRSGGAQPESRRDPADDARGSDACPRALRHFVG